jgi:hypothetical protein
MSFPNQAVLVPKRPFLTEVRSPEREAERLDRIQEEFVRGFENFFELAAS